MAGYFQIGETKVRPGAYFNVQKYGEEDGFGAVDGVVAVLFQASFGPLGEVSVLEREDGYEQTYGTDGTTDALREALYGGAKKLIACRIGSGGTAASAELEAAEGKVSLTAKYPGKKEFSVTIREKLTDDTIKECIVYAGTQEYEKVSFASGGDEAAALVEAFKNSDNFIAESAGASGAMTSISQTEFTAGTDPAVTNADYSTGLSKIEKYYFNTICVDTENRSVQELVSSFLDRIYDAGQFGIAVFAEKHTEALKNRMLAAAGFNKENVVYVLNPYVHAKETVLDGYQTAAYIAGMTAACPSSQSLTHMIMNRYTQLDEVLTNTEIIKAEKHGCLVLSYNNDDQVWIDSSINTLINPADNKDAGWKKVRRVKTRYELLYRANAQADALVGKVDNDVNGRAVIIGRLQKICNNMIDEGKLTAATVTENTEYAADGDSCWFNIEVSDKDSAEHIYLFYKFRFSTRIDAE